MKIKIDSDEELLLNNTIEIHNATMVVRVVFHENKYYPHVFLNECRYELLIIQKCFIMIELTLLKELMLIRQVN